MKKMIIGGYESESDAQIVIVNPSDLQPVDSVSYAKGTKEVEEATRIAEETFETFSAMPLASRLEMLRKAAELIQYNRDQLAVLLAKESGKPIVDARVEIMRAISVFTNSSEEVKTAIEGKTYRPDAYSYPADNGELRPAK
ncbi:MAG: aldehyde dehydrogenase family protein, partial [Nitrososphaeria archaeon]